MKPSNPGTLAIGASLTLSILTALATSFSDFVSTSSINWAHVLLQAMIVLALSYFVFYVGLRLFLYDSIVGIYNSVEELKSKADIGLQDVELGHEALDMVRRDVRNWAVERKTEIDQLKKMEQYRREFVGNVSHELKTPIFNIQGYILTLLDGGIDDATVNRPYLEKAAKSVDRMIAIVEDLDVITQIESGELQPFLEEYDIVSQIRDLVLGLEMKAAGKQISLVFDSGEVTAVNVFADRHLIRQALGNLVVNSIKYGNTGGKTIIRLKDFGGFVRVEIEDNGVGIEAVHLPRIFERFYRVDKGRSREHGGTGLGLSIVKHILESHGHSIEVKSEAGKGTTFICSIPKKQPN